MIIRTSRDRRLVGSTVLILAIVAAAVLSTVDGRRVAGTAAPITFPPAAQLGECVLPPFPDVRSGGFTVEIPVTDLDFGSCAGVISGEIIGAPQDEEADGAAQQASSRPCLGLAAEFAGLQDSVRSATLPGSAADGPVRWRPTIGANTYLVVPSDTERAAGHTWSACLAVPNANREYRGTLRNAYVAGTLPDQYGLCWAGVDLDEIPMVLACDEPHAAELLASGWIENRALVSRPDMEAACLKIAGRIMKTDDPTRGGAIRIVLDPVRRDGASAPDAPLAVGCFATVSGDRQLTHTVIGLADDPLPLAG